MLVLRNRRLAVARRRLAVRLVRRWRVLRALLLLLGIRCVTVRRRWRLAIGSRRRLAVPRCRLAVAVRCRLPVRWRLAVALRLAVSRLHWWRVVLLLLLLG